MADDEQHTAGASPIGGGPQHRRSTARATVATLAGSLWFPVLFFCGFLFCYLLAFHNPTPHDIEVAVPRPAAARLQGALDQAVPGGFKVVPVTDEAAVKRSIRQRDAAGGYVPDPKRPVLYTAKAGGFEIVAVLEQTFTPVAEQQGQHLTVVDLAPTAPKDGMGTSLFYLALALTIPSYIAVMMMLRATGFTRAKKITTFVVLGAVFSVAAYYIGHAMGIMMDEPVAMVYFFLLTQAVSLTSYGLVPFVRQFFPGVAITIFVLLSMPSSGGAIPVQMVPSFFRRLHPYMPLGQAIDATRSSFYFDGVDLAHPVLVLSVWVLAGIVLICLGWLLERRLVRKERETEGEDVTEADVESEVEDPSFEMPRPMPVLAHSHRIGASEPMLGGRIASAGAEPLHGVIVTVSDPAGHQLVRTVTDEHGEYRITGLPEGFADVMASGPGLVPAIRRVLCRYGHAVHQDFVLRPRS